MTDCQHTSSRNRFASTFLVLSLLAVAGCGEGKLGKEFRDAASTNLQTGVNLVMTGLIDGAFAAYDPEESEGSEQTTAN